MLSLSLALFRLLFSALSALSIRSLLSVKTIVTIVRSNDSCKLERLNQVTDLDRVVN